jgi:hypothetical protein
MVMVGVVLHRRAVPSLAVALQLTVRMRLFGRVAALNRETRSGSSLSYAAILRRARRSAGISART